MLMHGSGGSIFAGFFSPLFLNSHIAPTLNDVLVLFKLV